MVVQTKLFLLEKRAEVKLHVEYDDFGEYVEAVIVIIGTDLEWLKWEVEERI